MIYYFGTRMLQLFSCLGPHWNACKSVKIWWHFVSKFWFIIAFFIGSLYKLCSHLHYTLLASCSKDKIMCFNNRVSFFVQVWCLTYSVSYSKAFAPHLLKISIQNKRELHFSLSHLISGGDSIAAPEHWNVFSYRGIQFAS